jgi:hypothetical protein
MARKIATQKTQAQRKIDQTPRWDSITVTIKKKRT